MFARNAQLNSLLKATLFIALFHLVACASTSTSPDGQVNRDPLEGINRVVFKFNDGLDRILVKPLAKTYRYITPGFMEKGVSNFFSNLGEVTSLINSGLQGKGKKTAVHSGRFLINSTLGLLGLLDVAKHMGLEKQDAEDFGQTLATWGVTSGPYVVLPFLGPSTLRDGTALPVDMHTDPINHVEHDKTRYSLQAGKIIELRARLLDSEDLISGDRYTFIRDAYLQRRKYLIEDGEMDDSFGGDLDLKDEDF